MPVAPVLADAFEDAVLREFVEEPLDRPGREVDLRGDGLGRALDGGAGGFVGVDQRPEDALATVLDGDASSVATAIAVGLLAERFGLSSEESFVGPHVGVAL